MTDVTVTRAAEQSEPAPEHPTGAQDPFDPVDPDDPYSVTGAQDPLAPQDPDPDPTTTGGVEIPPPPSDPGQQPPPGHAELTSAVTSLGPLPDPKDPLQEKKLRTWRMAQEGRNSLSDQWSMLKRLQLATADVAANHAKDPTDYAAKLKQLSTDVATDSAVSTALDAWRAARDETPVDLTKLATAAADLKTAVDPLQKLLTVAGVPTDVDQQRQILGEALAGIVTEVASEGQQALAGERVSPGAASDVVTYHLTKTTRDENWASRLQTSSTWQDAGRMTRTAIGAKTLDTIVSKTGGKLDFEPLAGRLTGLDAALKARAKSSGKPDYATRSEVLRGYLGVADVLTTQLKTVRDRLAALAANPKSPGWDPVQARNAGDVLAGMAKALHDELATDPLIEDPDLAQAAQKARDQIDALAGQTSLQSLVDKAGNDLRKVWRTAKQAELKALKAAKVDLGNLPTMFESGGLGPLLDNWYAEVKKFPKQSRANVKDYAAQIAEQLQRYRTAINGQLGAERSSGLVEGLDVVAAALARQIRSFDSKGGLFD